MHVPFCVHKCHYCAFYSEPASGEVVERYTHALITELTRVAPDLRPQTLFFGGGTPTLLGVQPWREIRRAMDRFGWSNVQEWTVETNPATITSELAQELRDIGVNRISLGIQSLHDPLLQRLGRAHNRQQAFRAYDLLRHAGFNNINLDLMFAIPQQTMAIWQATLREVTAMQSEHLSCYEVTYEEDTPLYEEMAATPAEANADLACDMYEALLETAAQSGFRQYEISNFAKHSLATPAPVPNLACQHNVNYWRGGSFYGLGPSATSYVRGERSKNVSDTAAYCAALADGERPVESRETLSPLARAGEIAAFGLRMTCGWPFEDFTAITSYDLRQQWATEIAQLKALGYGQTDNHRFWLTPAGLRHADWVAEQFIRL